MQTSQMRALQSPASLISLPLTITDARSKRTTLARYMSLTAWLCGLFAPILLLSTASDAGVPLPALMASDPATGIQVALGLLIWAGLFAVPTYRTLSRLFISQTIEISDKTVSVTRHSLLGQTAWETPLRSYRGVAHVIRSSLSGIRHELLLVHEDPQLTVMIASAERMPQQAIDETTRSLGLPEIPAKSISAPRRKAAVEHFAAAEAQA